MVTPKPAGEMATVNGTRAPGYLLECPVCRCEYVRLSEVVNRDGFDRYATETGVKGDVTTLLFKSECGSEFEISYGFHKGATAAWSGVLKSCRIDYYTYIQSDEWKAKATAAKEAAGWRCQICNRPSSAVQLEAHHRTYERLGHERPDDITVLCRDCHELYETNRKARRNGKALP